MTAIMVNYKFPSTKAHTDHSRLEERNLAAARSAIFLVAYYLN